QAPVVDPEVRPPGPSRRAPSGWPALLAGASTAVAVSLLVDLRHGVMAGAATAVIVAAVPAGPRRRWVPADVLPRPLPLAVGVGVLATAGAVVADAAGSTAASLGQLALGWAVALLIVAFEPRRRRPDQPDELAQVRIAVGAAVVAFVAGVVALVAGAGAGAAVALLLAAPVAVAVFLAAAVVHGEGSDHIGRAVTALALGSVVGLTALAARPDGPPSTAMVATLTVATLVVVVIGAAIAVGRSISPWLAPAGLAVAALGAGAGGGPLAIVAVGALLVVHRSARRLAPVTRTVDTSAVTARRVVAALSVAAVAVRLYAPRGLWLDEATSVHQARLPFREMLELIYREDNHPPLHHVLLWLDVRLVGDSELALRLPSIVMGALLVPMLYLTGKELFSRRVGVIAAAIGTVAPLAVWYGQEARMYSQFMLLALVTVYAQVRILRGCGPRWWIAFTLASAALIATQYFAVLHVAATLVVFLVEIVRRRRTADARRLLKGVAAAIGAGVVLLAPLVPFALHQAQHNQQAGFGFSASGVAAGSPVVPPPSIYGFLTNIQWTVFGYQTDELTTRLVALWPIGLLLMLLVLGRPRRSANRSLLLIAGLPIAAVFGASLFAAKSRSLAEVRYFIGAVPVVFLLLAAGLTTVIASRRLQTVATVALLGAMVVTLGLQETSDQNPRLYQYREAMADIRAEAEPGDQVAYAPDYLDYVLEYYGPGVASAPLEDGLPTVTGGHVFLVQGSSFADSAEANSTVADAISKLEDQGLVVQERTDYAQMTVWRLG
ncbi:MAG: glycosyltransferase family 39 protein, partial [Ilumatobacteraceae bacterium]